MTTNQFEVVAIGCSTGGIEALQTLLKGLDRSFPLPLMIVAHNAPSNEGLLREVLSYASVLPVIEAIDKTKIEPSCVYVAPAGFHLLVERDRTCALSVDHKVAFCRPSIDVLFESMAQAYGKRLIGVLLTGSNDDGSKGLRAIGDAGGMMIVQDPDEAVESEMPRAALRLNKVQFVLPLAKIPDILDKLAGIINV